MFKHLRESHVVLRFSQRQGRHEQELFFMVVIFSEFGISFFSSVGPKIAKTLAPTAIPMCIGAESQQIKTSFEAISFAKSIIFLVLP